MAEKRKLVSLSKHHACTSCGETKPVDQFFRRKSAKYAFPIARSNCKVCEKGWYKQYVSDLVAEFGVPLDEIVKHNLRGLRNVECKTCGVTFRQKSRRHRYCSEICKAAQHRQSTQEQYEKLSGNWRNYFTTLLAQPHRRACGLTVEVLQRVFDRQQGLCALSGEPMTCLRKIGVKYKTNASIDRIEAKGSYAEDNIQLVCVAVNKFRIDMDIEEYINWCRKVAYNADKKKNV
jgi:hypothetical protein